MYEVEVKAKLNNRQLVQDKLISMGCTFSEELHQIDSIFIPEDLPFPPPFGTPVLRVRNQNGQSIFNLKINQSSRQDCIEQELEISDGDTMLNIIKLLKYKPVPTVDKKRIKTNYGGIEVVLDTVENLGEFIEAEKVLTENNPLERKKIQEELFTFLLTLGVQEEDRVIDGKYDIMLYEKFGMK